MASGKRKASDHGGDFALKRKKKKTVKTDSLETKKDGKLNGTDGEEFPNAELLDAKTIREGMLLLGCVTVIKPTYFLMSLPGCLTGIVPANNISQAFNTAVTSLSGDSELEEPSIESIIHVGAVYPCKVVEIMRDDSKDKPFITLSVDPEVVNVNLKPSALYLKMVLYVSICSVEDHGYIVDVGSKDIRGFLQWRHSSDTSDMLRIGAIIPTYVKKITVTDKKSANILVSLLSFDEEFPEVSSECLKLQSILPGAKISTDVIEIKQHFAYMKFLNFDVCAGLFSCGSMNKHIKVATTVQGTVLYIHPITNMIYLTLNSKPTPSTFLKHFGLRKFDCVINPKFEYFYRSRAYYKIKKGIYGFISVRDLPSERSSIPSSSSNPKGIIPKASVTSFHYIDNLVQLSAKPSLTEKKIILPEDVKIGEVYETTVVKHVEAGMHVSICPGLSGFVRRIHMSDVLVTKPEKLFPLKSKVKCRVLSSDGFNKVSLTCKESLLNLPDCYVLSSLETVQRGQFYKGVIVKITDTYILVLFFSNIQGCVPSSHIPASSVFFEGQTVVCEILNYNLSTKKLQLSLKTDGWCSLEEMVDDLNEHNLSKRKGMQNSSCETSEKDYTTLTVDEVTETYSSSLTYTGNSELEFDAQKPVEAVISKVKAHQLNILLDNIKGRVHITEVGCESEDVYPLKEFASNQKIEVYVIGEYVKKRKNFLKITHQNRVTFKECTLKLPSVPTTKIFKPGVTLIGFVKEVYDVYAIIWLSPNETGVLDYLHFSENVKFVRKLQKHLKVGVSLKVSVLDDEHSPMRRKNTHNIALTKLDCRDPQVGENILGLVQIACLERGLTVKLPFGYHGTVSLIDLTDIYTSALSLLEAYRRQRYIQCHVLEVNHETKYCVLSLRKSRLFKKIVAIGGIFCREITPDNVQQGDAVKGYVKSTSESAITVVFGRELEGQVEMHKCASSNCRACRITKYALQKYPPGSVLEVSIEKISLDKKSCKLNLTDKHNQKPTKSDRLFLKEDISWDEML